MTKKFTAYQHVTGEETRRFRERLIAAALGGYMSRVNAISQDGLKNAIKAADLVFKHVINREI